MKKRVAFVSVFLIAFLVLQLFIVSAQTPGDSEDYKKIKNLTGKIPIDPNTGQIDRSKFNETKSKAQQRVEKVNLWLKENASWLKIVLGMVPEISWLFFINLFLWLWFFTALILNGDVLFGEFIEKNKARLAGLGVFVILLVLKIYLYLSKFVYNIFLSFINYILPLGTLAVILFVIIGMIFFPGLMIVLLGFFVNYLKKRKEEKEKEETEIDRKVLKEVVKPVEEEEETGG